MPLYPIGKGGKGRRRVEEKRRRGREGRETEERRREMEREENMDEGKERESMVKVERGDIGQLRATIRKRSRRYCS